MLFFVLFFFLLGLYWVLKLYGFYIGNHILFSCLTLTWIHWVLCVTVLCWWYKVLLLLVFHFVVVYIFRIFFL